MQENEQIIDSENTTNEEAQELLSNLCEEGFSGDVGKLALVLGRDEDEIREMIGGDETIDEDLLMKIRGIIQERDIPTD